MDVLSSFHFLRPWWLLLAVPPALAAVRALFGKRHSEQWRGVIAPHLLEQLVTKQDERRWLSPEVLLLPFALVLAVAMAGPAYRLADTPEGPDDTTLLLVVDLSSSMKGRDIGPSRIGRLRLKLRDLIDLRRGGRIGLIAVAGSAHVVMPPTDDGDALVPYVDVLAPDLMPEDGERFERAASLASALTKGEKGPTVVLVAADSIPPDGAQALGNLQRSGTMVVGWAVGTQEGDRAQQVPGLDRTGFDALSRSGAPVVDLGLGGSDLRRIDRLLDRARTASVDPDDASLWEDSGYSLVFLFAVGVLLWFRKGWVLDHVHAALLALLVTGCSAGDGTSAWLDPWLTPDQQGRRLFEQGRYKEAARVFRDPMWKGIAHYTAHDWKDAQAQFSRVDTVDGLFNLANAHAQAREIASAIAIYNQVLQRQPTHRGARKNRDYFQEVLSSLQQTSDFDDLKKPPGQPADPTKAKVRPDQVKGPQDLAAKAEQKKDDAKPSLSQAENAQWMRRVATNPADFLRAKFAAQEQRGATR